jgi:phosphoribosylformylglycinamidine synthase
MGQLAGCIEGMAEAARALDFPVVSGNVSLYNETNGKAIPPTPAIGGVGLLPDIDRMATLAFKAEGEAIFLVGAPPSWGTHLGQSVYLREVAGREEGPPPPVDLAHERRVGDFVRALIRERVATAVHDCSDGGLCRGACRDGDGARASAPTVIGQGQLLLPALRRGSGRARGDVRARRRGVPPARRTGDLRAVIGRNRGPI